MINSPTHDSHQPLTARRRTVLGGIGVGIALAATPLGTPTARAETAVDGFTVTAILSHLGQVELTWPETSDERATWYTVHRDSDRPGQSGALMGPTPKMDTALARIGVYGVGVLATDGPTRPPAFGDFSAQADSSHTYQVVVRDADGTALATSATTSITLGDRIDEQRLPLVAWSYRDSHERVVISWRVAPGARGPVEVTGGIGTQPDPGWLDLGTVVGSGSITVNRGQSKKIDHVRVAVGSTETTMRVFEPQRSLLLLSAERRQLLRTDITVAGSTAQTTLARLLEDIDTPYLEWTFGKPFGPERVAAIKASHAALAWQLTDDPVMAERSFTFFAEAAALIYFGTENQPLFLGSFASRLAVAYNWAGPAWTSEQQHYARQVLSRIAAIWSATHYINDVRETKSSNWVGITRSGEVLVRLALLGSDDYIDDVHRTALAIDELNSHVADGYGSNGYTQEGLAYFIYPMREITTAVAALRTAGVDALEAELTRHEWVNLALRTQSMMVGGHRTQFGVDTGTSSSHQFAGEFMAQALALAPARQAGVARWAYDHVSGVDSTAQDFGTELGRENTLLGYLAAIPPVDPDTSEDSTRALLDDHVGAYFFRNRHQDVDDVLVGTFNRNAFERGWEALETFGLPILGFNTRWTVMAEKGGVLWRQSKPLVDGAAETATGRGRTLVSQAFAGQGGGHLELDASGNYEIATARRSMVVDMQARDQVATVIAVRDHFADASAHEWTWQLPIGPGVQRHRLADESGMKSFIYRRDGGWMKGWVIPADGQTVYMDRGTVKGLVVQGTSTSTLFRVLLALGRGTEPVATRSGHVITVAGKAYDLDNLAGFGG